MSEAFSWLGELVRGLGKIVPRLSLVKAGYGGLLYLPGGRIKVRPAGLCVWWPLISELETVPVARQTMAVPRQPLVTKDGVTVVAGAVITFEVVDLERFSVGNLDTFDDVDDVAQVALFEVVAMMTYDALRVNFGHADQELRRGAQRRLSPYGVRVRKMNLNSLARTQVFYLVGGGSGVVPLIGDQEVKS